MSKNSGQLLLGMLFLPVAVHGVFARVELATLGAGNWARGVGPDVSSVPIPAVPLIAVPCVCEPPTNQLPCGGSPHVVRIAKVVHQLVKVGAHLAAGSTARTPPTLMGIVVCCGSHSTQLHQQSGKNKKTKAAPSGGRAIAPQLVRVVYEGLLFLQAYERERIK